MPWSACEVISDTDYQKWGPAELSGWETYSGQGFVLAFWEGAQCPGTEATMTEEESSTGVQGSGLGVCTLGSNC